MEPALSPPNADAARQAIHAIRGYEYQILAAALAWVDLDENGLIYLEVAEDYAHVVRDEIEAVQVKATRGSGAVTLNTPAVRDAIESFVNLVGQNRTREVHLRFLTTAPIGLEKSPDDRPGGRRGLEYWQRVRSGLEDVGPLRTILERESNPEAVRDFCRCRNDQELLEDLVRRVTWDCGREDATILRRELEERVSRFLRKELNVSSQEALPIVDVLVADVLRRSAMRTPYDRVLSRQKLHQLAEVSTRISVQRSYLEQLLSKSLASPGTSTSGHAMVPARGLGYSPWIVNAATLPTPKVLIRREALETLVQSAMKATGLCFVVGPTGTGKSILARCIAATFPGPRYSVDLRDAESSEAQDRLKQVLIHLAEMGPATLMLEDLNCLSAPSAQTSLSEVVGAARRRDMRIIITSYGRPTATLLNALNTDSTSIVSSSHFDLEETCELVRALDGDLEAWGRVAHLACGAGHPQLTYAFVAGTAARGWPKHEIDEIIARGLTNADLEDEHSAARANLIDSLTDPARDLLYRLSIIAVPFERCLAVTIGTIDPVIERASECFDELVDRWLEPATVDRYRISPLVRGIGQKMLTTNEQCRAHDVIATEMSSRNPINAGEIDAILVHGLAGSSRRSLFRLSMAISVSDNETREAIAKHLFVFPALDTSKPLYPKDLPTSVMLRLAQLRLVMAIEKRRRVNDIVQALFSEVDAIPDGPMRTHFDGLALISVLSNLGIARDLRNWVDLLSRFRRLDLTHHEDTLSFDPEIPPVAVLFSTGIADLNSEKKLEDIFDALSGLDEDERRELLTPIDPSVEDYFFLIHHPWIARSRRPGFNAIEAVDSYMKMGAQAESWGQRILSVQCYVAVAMILDERLGDTAQAICVLEDAATRFGGEPMLVLALAKLNRRLGQGTEALGYFRDAVPRMPMLNSVHAVYTVREAAICAAECGEWDTAGRWFLQAHTASGPLDDIGLGAIGIGLLADAAVARFQAGDLRNALTLLKAALLSLAKIEPDSNLQTAHCHRLIRHAILWLQAKVEGQETMIEGEPIAIIPGACSNPEPAPAIEHRPLGHIDFAWYMLAGVELANGLDVGVRQVVNQFGAQGYIPLSEHLFRTQILGTAISAQNPADFMLHFSDYLASATYCAVNREAIQRLNDLIDPERVEIPALPRCGPYDLVTEHSAQHAILAYGVRSLLVEGGDVINHLREALRREFGNVHPGSSLFDNLDSTTADGNDLDREVASLLRRCQTERPPPDLIFLTGVRLTTWIALSPFKSVLIPHLKPWLIANWERIIQSQRFLLWSPATTTPPIVEALRRELEGESFAAALSLVAVAAVGGRLSPELRQELERLAHRLRRNGSEPH